jgi:arylformamidase
MGDFNRRTMFGAAAALAATAGSALAQAPAPRQKGPRVWLDLDQQELDDAYDQSKYAPNIQQVLKRYEVNSEGVRARFGAPKRLAYGPTPIEAFDLYPARGHNLPVQNLPVHVFVHGGAWRVGLAKNYAFPTETFVRAGAHFITLDFTNVVETKGELMPMADQVRRALAWIYKNAASFGGDANRIWLSGHSSGGHLAGVLLTTDWNKDFGLPKDIIKGGVCCSGIFDLKPARLSARSNYVTFTDEVEHALSPQRHLEQLNCPVVVAYGTYETPEFQRQSRDFAAAVKAAGKPVELLVGDGYNHFEIAETFANPYGLLGRACLEQMKLAPV